MAHNIEQSPGTYECEETRDLEYIEGIILLWGWDLRKSERIQ